MQPVQFPELGLAKLGRVNIHANPTLENRLLDGSSTLFLKICVSAIPRQSTSSLVHLKIPVSVHKQLCISNRICNRNSGLYCSRSLIKKKYDQKAFGSGICSRLRDNIETVRYRRYESSKHIKQGLCGALSVIDDLGSGSPQLKLHCASKDDDFGIHFLSNTQDFRWSFCEHEFRRTMYFCHFWWGSKENSFEVFNDEFRCVHKADIPSAHKSECVWVVRPDGFYLGYHQKNGNLWTFKHHDW
ncbi:uncharacterized protein LOC132639850 [Lycium barbarum]|uniref:uncharacterized protein LOC132639850 n=1 Tax=Lycium barbarum TaxID=112863 RepID=UPI00293F1B21|nr:uncharacterized protein LOC132639850 [Lycium barbarum]